MVDSALGLDPKDLGETAKAKRRLRGLRDLDGITFVAQIMIEPTTNPAYKDTNRLAHAATPDEPQYGPVTWLDGAARADQRQGPQGARCGAVGRHAMGDPGWQLHLVGTRIRGHARASGSSLDPVPVPRFGPPRPVPRRAPRPPRPG